MTDVLTRRGVEAGCSDAVSEMADTVWNNARPGDVVLILSNGALGGIHKIFREKAGRE